MYIHTRDARAVIALMRAAATDRHTESQFRSINRRERKRDREELARRRVSPARALMPQEVAGGSGEFVPISGISILAAMSLIEDVSAYCRSFFFVYYFLHRGNFFFFKCRDN